MSCENKYKKRFGNKIVVIAFTFLLGCSDQSSDNQSKNTYEGLWTWVSGSNFVDQPGTYGAKGVASPTNIPGARLNAVTWIDSNDNLWLFGGYGLGSSASSLIDGALNDLWRWDGSNWTWISGRDLPFQNGTYGTKGIADAANVPGAREESISWIDSNGNFWLFGGMGYDSRGAGGKLNDLWRWDGSNWTWISGSNFADQSGIYGIKGIADSANVPGGRFAATSWTDSEDGLWLFGGWGLTGTFNDLWKRDGSSSNWTWISGSDTAGQSGIYGNRGIADANNTPGARQRAVSWVDTKGNFWLFGGTGVDSNGVWGQLNDLWRWDGNNWTWVSGSNIVDQPGNYGIKGTASAANVPSARTGAASWIDADGDMWLFGGNYGGFQLNDLWLWDGSNWTWISGSNDINQSGTYGSKGTAQADNIPGSRHEPLNWIDSSGNVWLFGGYGFDSTGSAGGLNDLWRYE